MDSSRNDLAQEALAVVHLSPPAPILRLPRASRKAPSQSQIFVQTSLWAEELEKGTTEPGEKADQSQVIGWTTYLKRGAT